MISAFNFSLPATLIQSFLDSNPQTPEGSQEEGMGLTLDNTVTPTTFRQLVLSVKDLDWPEDTVVHSKPSDMDQGQGGSNDACS